MSSLQESPQSWKWKETSIVHREMFKRLLEHGKECPNSIKEVNGVRVCLAPDFLIGKGADGTRVYIGLSKDGLERAVKRLPKDTCTPLAENEMKLLTELKTTESKNVIRYWFLDSISDEEYFYLILHLCEETLKSYVDRESEVRLSAIAPKIIQQILEGLADLHRDPNPILHRDLKPSNVMRKVNGDWLLADFGIGRILQGDETTRLTGQMGSQHWRAVESSISSSKDGNMVRYKKASDIQVAGMLAYYIVTKGKHPFGEERDLLRNLLDGKPVGLDMLEDPAIKDLLTWMLSHDPKDRPSAEEALKHPYLQSKKQRFKLLCNMGNQPEIKNRNMSSKVVQELTRSFSTDWKTLMKADDLKYLCTAFVDGKVKTFHYRSIWTECLRFMRNANQHWNDPSRPMSPPEALSLVKDPEEYFLKVFPADLPVVVHRIVRSRDCDWKGRPELQEFFK